MGYPSPALVVVTDRAHGARLLGGWLAGAGLDLREIRPYAGEALPGTLDGYGALVVLGGEPVEPVEPAEPVAGVPAEPEALLRAAVRSGLPTLGVGFGAQLLATAHGGMVEPDADGLQAGAGLVARRDIAARDPLFAEVPFAPDVIHWHRRRIVALPGGAVPLAVSTGGSCEAFRLGDAAWGVQFHIECDTELFAAWAMERVAELLASGYDPVEVVAAVDRVLPDVAEVWRPFAQRFARLVEASR